MYWVYLLRCGDGSLYAGITTDPARRLRQHRGRALRRGEVHCTPGGRRLCRPLAGGGPLVCLKAGIRTQAFDPRRERGPGRRRAVPRPAAGGRGPRLYTSAVAQRRTL